MYWYLVRRFYGSHLVTIVTAVSVTSLWALARYPLVGHGISMIEHKILEFRTKGRGMTEISAEVGRAVASSRIRQGVWSLILCENADADVRRDLETVLARLAPDGDPAYVHDTEGPDDMAAHVRTVLTSNSLTIPVAEGRLMLGTWQGIYLWEHRITPHTRSLVVTISGET